MEPPKDTKKSSHFGNREIFNITSSIQSILLAAILTVFEPLKEIQKYRDKSIIFFVYLLFVNLVLVNVFKQ